MDEYSPVTQLQLPWTVRCSREDAEYLSFFLLECFIRVEMTAEAITWPVLHRHLPCWEVLLQQARAPELAG